MRRSMEHVRYAHREGFGSFACAKIRSFWPAIRVLARIGLASWGLGMLSPRTGSADLGFFRMREPSRVERGWVACQSAVSCPKIGDNSARAARAGGVCGTIAQAARTGTRMGVRG